MCGEVTFAGSHLVGVACKEFVEAHERVGDEARWVGVVLRSREVFSSLVQEVLWGPPSEGCVGVTIPVSRGDTCGR